MTLTSTMPRLHALLAVLVFGSHVLCHSQAFLINKLSFITSGQRQHPIAPTAALTVKRTSLLGRRDSHDHDWRRRDHAGRLERCGRGLQHLRSLADEDNMGIESGDGGDVQALLASETPFIELDERDGVDRRGIFGGLQNWWERDGKEDLKIYAASLAVALVIRTVAIEPRYIPSLSMFPTFEIGDQLAVEKLSVKFSRPYQRKDVVVFYPPPKFREFSAMGEQEALIKRVIAVDGDVVEIKNGNLIINGEQQLEDYVFEEPEYKWGPQKVPEGMVMVLGDNRNHSLDSHIWGFLPRENVIGRAVFKYWPPWRAGLVEK